VTQALQRAFGFKGRYTPMLDEVIVPVYVVQDPAPAVLTRLAAASVSQAASTNIGDFQHVRLWNPPDSGVLGVVNLVRVQVSDNFDDVTTKPHTILAALENTNVTPAGSVAVAVFRDTRFKSQVPALEIIADIDQSITTAEVFAQILFPGGFQGQPAQTIKVDSADPRQPLVLLEPGSFMEVSTGLAGGAEPEPRLRVNMQWLEVPITEQSPFGGIPGT